MNRERWFGHSITSSANGGDPMQLESLSPAKSPARQKPEGGQARCHSYGSGRSRGAAGAKLETTLGEFIVTLTDETHRHVHDEAELYEVVAYLLSERLALRPKRLRGRCRASTLRRRERNTHLIF
jgi:hypothetical protein